MATIVGRNAKVFISSTGAFSGEEIAIGKVMSTSLSISDDALDETNNDSAGYKEALYGDRQASLDFDFKYDSADTGQADLITAKNTQAKRWFRFEPKTAPFEKRWTFAATITDLTVDTSTDAVEDGSCSVESTGIITLAGQ